MSRRPTVRAKQRKNPHPPAALPDSMDRRAAASPATPPAEVGALPGVVAVDFPRTPRGVGASPARVFPVAAVLVGPGKVVLAALVQNLIRLAVAAPLAASPAVRPEALVSAVHSPKLLRKRKSPNPAQQEQGRLRQLESLGWELLALSLAKQESRPAVPSVLLPQNPGTAGMFPRHLPRPHQGRGVPARHSRNHAGPPERTSPR